MGLFSGFRVMTDWLSRFGTARITLGVDEDFSLEELP